MAMSSLFQDTNWIETEFKVNSQGGKESVLVGKGLWESLAVLDRRLAISIAPRRRSSKYSLPTLICWAVLDERTTGISIPPHWLKVYNPIFLQTPLFPPLSQDTLLVASVRPVLLTDVIVTALSSEAYRVANTQDYVLEDWLSRDSPILRQGDIHTFYSEPLYLNGQDTVNSRQVYQYRVDMVEPVLQGYARKGDTQFVVTVANKVNEGCALPGDGSESDTEGIEIDEGFLASSVLPSSSSAPVAFRETRASVTNGRTDVIGGSYKGLLSEASFRAEALPEPVSSVQDDCTLYLRTVDLSRVGVLNGDWAVARSGDTLRYRLVRVVAFDSLVHITGMLMASPLLLRNISEEPSSSATTLTFLRASPFGCLKPTIPVAKTVTVARVASPFSTDRSYQPLFLSALKKHFAGIKRLVKQGDMIAVGIDTDTLHRTQELDSKLDDMVDIINDLHDFDICFPASSIRLNEVVFFVITNIEHDVFSGSEFAQDMYVGSTIGELGCWIDSAVTRIVQTGVEHSRVPMVGGYMGIGSPRGVRMTASSCLLRLGSTFGRIFAISSATLARRAVDYSLPLSVLLKGARGTGKFTVANCVAQCLGMHLLEVNCYEIIGENDSKTEGTIRARFDTANACSPCILVLRHVDALVQTTQTLESGTGSHLANVLQDCIGDLQKTWKATGYPILVFATTTEPGKVPLGVLSCFKHEVIFEAPGELDRYDILSSLLVESMLSPDVSLSTIATQTAAFVASDLADLVVRARSISVERAIRATNCKKTCLTQAGIPLTAVDFDVALGKARTSYSESIGAPKIPNVTWDDVGGLAHVKSDIMDTIQLPLDHPELFSDGLKKRSGILLYGPPGTGKTLLAKAVATSCSLNFFSVKGPELLNMYIGESEANVRRVFQRARNAKPCVIFFDELDSVAPKRGNLGDSGGVMDRIVSQLLAELDGMSANNGGVDIFVIGATNRPDLLDPALLRPGRFDRMLYLGLCGTHDAQFNILQALTRKFQLDPGFNLSCLAEQCPFNYTGADFYALCSDAMLNAMSRKAAEIETKIEQINKNLGPHIHPHPVTPQYYLTELASSKDRDVLVSQQDFDLALRNLVPSVSQSDMEHYASIQRQFSREFSEQLEWDFHS